MSIDDWWSCPNDPKCVHTARAHEKVRTGDVDRWFCWAKDCACGRYEEPQR